MYNRNQCPYFVCSSGECSDETARKYLCRRWSPKWQVSFHLIGPICMTLLAPYCSIIWSRTTNLVLFVFYASLYSFILSPYCHDVTRALCQWKTANTEDPDSTVRSCRPFRALTFERDGRDVQAYVILYTGC